MRRLREWRPGPARPRSRASGHPKCAVCATAISGRYTRTPFGENVCGGHAPCSRCLGHHRARCTDRREAVQSDTDAYAAAAVTDRGLADLLGLRLPTIPLRLSGDLRGKQLGQCVKGISSRGDRSATIAIRPGLDPRIFSMVYVHEGTHALLHLGGAGHLDPVSEEGLCQYVAWCYLTAADISPELAEHIRHDPDPVYGEGLRRHLRAAERVGHAAYLRRLRNRSPVIPAGQNSRV